MPTAAGHDVRLSYLWEDDSNGNPNFAGTPNDSDNKPFGSDARLTTREGSNNAVRVFDPNSREARNVIEQLFEGAWAVEFTLTNPWFLRGLLHNGVSQSGSSAPYTYTFDGEVPYSMRILEGNEETGNEYALKGCVVASGEATVSVDGQTTVTLNGAYADEEQVVTNDVASLTAQPSVLDRPFQFHEATVERPSGTTLSLIQSVTLSIENNTDLIPELGSRFAVDYSPKVRNISLDYGDIVEDDSEVKRMYGDSAATSPQSEVSNSTTIALVFDNGKTGSDKNLVQIDLSTVLPDSYSRSGQGDPEADLEGQLNEIPASVTATAEVDESSAR